MTNPNLTSINVILDRSGSMGTIRNDVIGGFNAFLEDQQKGVSGEATVSLIQFDDRYEVNYLNVPIEKAEKLSEETYVPRGMTALLDAMGRTINDLGDRLRGLPENERPSRVLVMVFTDGYENSSQEFTQQKIAELVKQQEDQWNWTFLFLGANIDSFATGGSLGISANSTINYDSTSKGIRSAYFVGSNAVRELRNASDEEYLDRASLNLNMNRTVDEDEIDNTDFDTEETE
jgi:hypothetical protein